MVARLKTVEIDDPVVVWVHRSQAGDVAAFEELVRRYERPVFTFLLGLLRHSHDAEDVAQDVWVKVAASLPRLRDPERFTPWLYRTAHNCYIDFVRARRARPQTPLAGWDDGIPEPVDPDSFGPEQNVVSLDERRKVWETLGGLIERHRTALFLREYEGLSYAEIGRTMGISEGAAEMLLFRAREGFRRQFSKVDEARPRCAVNPLSLSAMIDDELSPVLRAEMDRHLLSCDPCSSRVTSMEAGRKLYRGLGLVAMPEAARVGILAKVAALFGGGGAAATAASVGGGSLAGGGGAGVGAALVAKLVAVALSVGAVATVVETDVPLPNMAGPALEVAQQAIVPSDGGHSAQAKASGSGKGSSGAPGVAGAALSNAESSKRSALEAASAEPKDRDDERRGSREMRGIVSLTNLDGILNLKVRWDDDGDRKDAIRESVRPDGAGTSQNSASKDDTKRNLDEAQREPDRRVRGNGDDERKQIVVERRVPTVIASAAHDDDDEHEDGHKDEDRSGEDRKRFSDRD